MKLLDDVGRFWRGSFWHDLLTRRATAAGSSQTAASTEGVNGARDSNLSVTPEGLGLQLGVSQPSEIPDRSTLKCDSYSHEVHREDVGRAGASVGIWVICDGVSNPRAIADRSPSGTSQAAASKVADALLKELSQALAQSGDDLSLVLRAFDIAFASLHEHVQPGDGDTTALALAYKRIGSANYWCYGYLGTGLIVLVNPVRRIGGIAHAEVLLSPHEDGDTVAISARPQAFSASIGAVLARPGDLMLLSSDGLVAAWSALVAKRLAPAEVLLDEVEQRGLNSALDRFVARSDASLRDDTTAYLVGLAG
jgi:hypothetical protein